MLGRSCLGALLTQTCEVLHRAAAVNVLYILQTGLHVWHSECIVGPRPKIQSMRADWIKKRP